MNDYKIFLEHIKLISLKYRDAKENDKFNIFSILRDETDEVNLHSKFIYFLLNPKGTHGQGDLFLRLFLNQVFDDDQISKPKVFREHKKIDILIEDENKSIIIENKINAGDQNKQLERYFDVVNSTSNKIQVIYLTKTGSEPSENSIGKLKTLKNPKFNYETDFYLISYSVTILNWLSDCIKEVATIPIIRETLVQYQNLIKKLTEQSTTMEERFEILDFLREGENAVLAKKIVENWIHLKWHLHWDFWHELESEIINRGFNEIFEIAKFSKDKITQIVHNKRNVNPYFGIVFPIKKIQDYDVCIKIENNDKDDNMIYGIKAYKDKTEKVDLKNVIFDEIATKAIQSAKGKLVYERENGWITPMYSQKPLNLDELSYNTIQIVNNERRRKYISDFVSEIETFINAVR